MDYQRIYQALIQKGQQRMLAEGTYVERHHITPRCLGGTDDAANIVALTPEEHVVAHLLLVKIYPKNTRLVYAANMMTSRVKSNKEYGWVKRNFAAVDSAAKIGVPRSRDSIEKQRATLVNKYQNGYVSPRNGRTISEKHKQAVSAANRGKKVPEQSKSSLAGYIIRYGEVEGRRRYDQDRKKKDSMSLAYFVNKYGEQEGHAKYIQRRLRLSAKMSENPPFKGKSHTAESRAKISKATTGKSKFRSPEHNQKIGLAQRGRIHSKVTCPHCGKTGGASIMSRWHGDRCKQKS